MQRLFVRERLADGGRIALNRSQANYLVNVLRMKDGDPVLAFNGRDGEWLAGLACDGRRAHGLIIAERTRPQPAAADLHYLFAPLKHARLDYMVGKAVEMGVGRLRPVLTRHGQATRVNLQRMEANAIEAAEQCGILTLPAIDPPVALGKALDGWRDSEPGRRLIFCDEDHGDGDPLAILSGLTPTPLALLIGPEGGFSQEERDTLRSAPFVTPLPLGPRILRADTAAVAALALVQATLGDWTRPAPASSSLEDARDPAARAASSSRGAVSRRDPGGSDRPAAPSPGRFAKKD